MDIRHENIDIGIWQHTHLDIDKETLVHLGTSDTGIDLFWWPRNRIVVRHVPHNGPWQALHNTHGSLKFGG